MDPVTLVMGIARCETERSRVMEMEKAPRMFHVKHSGCLLFIFST